MLCRNLKKTMARTKAFKEVQQLSYKNIQIPLEIYHEWRQSARVSLSKNKAIVRLPIMVALSTKEQHLDWAKEWIVKKLKKDDGLLSQFSPKIYPSDSEITVRGTVFQLKIEESKEKKSATGKRIGQTLFITIPANLHPRQKNQVCSTIIHRIMSQTYSAHLKRRVDELNDQFFQREINEIRLKNNSSNWGSCSSNKNINLSSRLLLAPDFVLDYIIIHELAHLVHHNHSQTYWKLVERVMPDYMKAEEWLKKFGNTCNW